MICDSQTIAVFTDTKRNFTGNPATCMVLNGPLSEARMQQIATKNNQPATTFLWPVEGRSHHFNVRWYAVDEEILLCGHGAAAAAIYLGKKYNSHEPFTLTHRQGTLIVQWQMNDRFKVELDAFPTLEELEVPMAVKNGLGIPILGMYSTEGKHIVLVESERELANMTPDFKKLRESDILGYAITAAGDEVDFVSRTLIPHYHQLEDHATGSSHAALVPFWAKKLGKHDLTALQLSRRGGKFICKIIGERNTVSLEGEYSILETFKIEI
jgi:PhzF family phenazine biosynthesis protein